MPTVDEILYDRLKEVSDAIVSLGKKVAALESSYSLVVRLIFVMITSLAALAGTGATYAYSFQEDISSLWQKVHVILERIK